ncbi:MAG: class A beta-lactamase-related serine hydrolase [Alphaproteobacteria bacterium]|nr:class A beta-lactamase-related serine hydrolase [Alphaproteobacteria bacterium]
MKISLRLLLSILFLTGTFISCRKTDEKVSDPNQALIVQMKQAADSVVKTTKVPGVVALVVDRKKGIDWLYSTGVRDIPNNLPSDGNLVFRIGSVTKTLTITVLLQLVGEGKLNLSDKLSKFFPQYPKADSVTILMLTNMTSRIHDYFHIEPSLFITMRENPTKIWTHDELVNLGFQAGYDASPGSGWGYSNTNTILIGKIIERITGNSLEQEITNRIIRPLNLVNTGFITTGVSLPGDHGRGYYFIDYIPGEDFTEYFDASVYWAAGSAYSTPRELQKFAETLVGGGLLPDTLQVRRLNRDFYQMSDVAYGIGIAKQGTFYGHSGEMPAYMTNMYHSNDKQCSIIIYYNSLLIGPENDPSTLFTRFVHILYGPDF